MFVRVNKYYLVRRNENYTIFRIRTQNTENYVKIVIFNYGNLIIKSSKKNYSCYVKFGSMTDQNTNISSTTITKLHLELP